MLRAFLVSLGLILMTFYYGLNIFLAHASHLVSDLGNFVQSSIAVFGNIAVAAHFFQLFYCFLITSLYF